MARTQKNAQPSPPPSAFPRSLNLAGTFMRKDKGLNGDLDRLPMLTWIMFLKFLDDMEQIAEQEAQFVISTFSKSRRFRTEATRLKLVSFLVDRRS